MRNAYFREVHIYPMPKRPLHSDGGQGDPITPVKFSVRYEDTNGDENECIEDMILKMGQSLLENGTKESHKGDMSIFEKFPVQQNQLYDTRLQLGKGSLQLYIYEEQNDGEYYRYCNLERLVALRIEEIIHLFDGL